MGTCHREQLVEVVAVGFLLERRVGFDEAEEDIKAGVPEEGEKNGGAAAKL